MIHIWRSISDNVQNVPQFFRGQDCRGIIYYITKTKDGYIKIWSLRSITYHSVNECLEFKFIEDISKETFMEIYKETLRLIKIEIE